MRHQREKRRSSAWTSKDLGATQNQIARESTHRRRCGVKELRESPRVIPSSSCQVASIVAYRLEGPSFGPVAVPHISRIRNPVLNSRRQNSQKMELNRLWYRLISGGKNEPSNSYASVPCPDERQRVQQQSQASCPSQFRRPKEWLACDQRWISGSGRSPLPRHL